MVKNKSKKLLALLLAAVMLLSVMPMTAFAAPKSDIPVEMLDNDYLDALAYTGYDVQAQKDDGTIFVKYSSSVSASIRSNIGYGTGPSGLETVSGNTVSGKAPNISKFEAEGLCCASYVSYVYYNYLPNVAGVDTSGTPCPSNPRSASAYNTAANNWVTNGQARRITFSQNADGTSFKPSEEIPIGSLVVFKHIPTGDIAHVAVYAGYYNGQYWVTHVGNDRGPEFCTIVGMSKGDYPEAVVQVVAPEFVEANGVIEVYKKDTNGKNLSGAVFVATSKADGTQYKIGPTNANGYAVSTDPIPYGDYTVKETVFPTDHRAYGQSEWNVTVSSNNDGKVTINAVNEEIPATCHLVKTSEDGKVSGISFTISGNGVNKTVTTGNNGTVDVTLKAGTYTVTEQSYDKYEPQKSQSVTLLPGKTATVTFNNTLKRGDLVVTKTAEDGLTEGARFHLSGTSLSGLAVNEYAVVGSDGKAYFNDVLIGTGYVLKEVDTEIRYVVPEQQTAAVEWNAVTEKSFHNVLKKWRAEVFKIDDSVGGGVGEPVALSLVSDDYVAELGTPFGETQGDATLGGAVYGLYCNGKLLDEYTTDKNGYFVTDYYPCTVDGEQAEYYLLELSASEGYLCDPYEYYIDCYADYYSIELNTEYMTVYETVIRGNLSIIKHTDDGTTQLETPEVGAEFSVYLKSAGSYAAAEETERDYLVCDENGYAETKFLPYGIYTVHQESGWDGCELLPDFDVYIAEDGHTYRYLANNALFESYIKVVKVDAETGKIIPYAGAGFQLFRPDGSKITQTYTYPEVTTIDTFYTNAEGYLITPETLEYGTGYYLIEVSAPYSYVLDSTPVYFDVTADNASVENALTVVTVKKQNMAQKGVIKISKTGEVFNSVTETDGIYQPVFAVKGLSGAVYEITAAEDIYTPDGTLRYAAGEVVDTVTTDETGVAASKPLYLGKFNITEITAPHGMVLNKTTHTAELVYAGQETHITETEADFYNDRQKVQLTAEKTMEQNELFGIGANGEITAVTFGLYATEEMTAADGSVIPANGLLEILSFDENGKATAKTDLPFGSYYLQELTTDSHYILSDTKYPVTFSYAGQDTALVEIKVDNGNAIENKLIYGEIHGLKTDDGGNAIGGAVFGLFKADCTEFTEDNALMLATSAEDGSFAFTKVPYGNWVVRELSVAPCYVMSEESYGVTVDKDGAVIEVKIENTLIRGTVQLTKVDKDYPDNKLTGAVFEVYRDTNGDKVLDDGDELLGTLTEIETGIYEMAELVYGGFFIKEHTAPTGFYLDENAYYFEITEHGKTVVVENEAGIGFVNAPMQGSLKIVKTSADGKLEGFSFRVTGANGYDEVFITDEKGEILIENLRIGEYTVSEVADNASAGYVLPDDKTANVMDSAVTIVEMHNLLREYPDSPQTGDNTNIPLLFGIMGVSVIGMITVSVVGRKKRFKGDAE